MQNLRPFQDALARYKRLNSSRSFAYERGGMRWSRFRSLFKVCQKNDSVFERFRALVPIFLAVYAAISLLGNWFHESLHCHCDHCSECVCIVFDVNAENGCLVDAADSCDEFDCPICRLLTHNRSCLWLLTAFSSFVAAVYFLIVLEQVLSTVHFFVFTGRAPPLSMSC